MKKITKYWMIIVFVLAFYGSVLVSQEKIKNLEKKIDEKTQTETALAKEVSDIKKDIGEINGTLKVMLQVLQKK